MSHQAPELTSDDQFSFGVAELARAEQLSLNPSARQPARVIPPPQKTTNTGFDPYNSGAFDKRKAWTSIRKR